MSVNPAQCDALLILYEEKLFFVLGVAIIRPSTLLGNEDMGNGKFIPHQFSTENSTCLYSPGSVGTGQLEKPWAELPRHHHVAQSIDCRSCNGEGRNVWDHGAQPPQADLRVGSPRRAMLNHWGPATVGSTWGSHPYGGRKRAVKSLLQPLATAIGSMLFQEKKRGFNHSS